MYAWITTELDNASGADVGLISVYDLLVELIFAGAATLGGGEELSE